MNNKFTTIKKKVITATEMNDTTTIRIIGGAKMPFRRFAGVKLTSTNEMNNIIAKTRTKIAKKRSYAQIAKNINNAYAKMHSHAE